MAILHLSREELQAVSDLYATYSSILASSPALESAITKVSTNLTVEKYRAGEGLPLARRAAQRATEVL